MKRPASSELVSETGKKAADRNTPGPEKETEKNQEPPPTKAAKETTDSDDDSQTTLVLGEHLKED